MGCCNGYSNLRILAVDRIVSGPGGAQAEGNAVRGDLDRYSLRRAVQARLRGCECRTFGADIHSRRSFGIPVAGNHRIYRGYPAGAALDPEGSTRSRLRQVAGVDDGRG